MKTHIKTWTSFLLFLSFLFLQTWASAQDSEVLSIHKTSPATANPGDLITYVIEYSNVGTAEANNVVIKDYLPAGNLYTYVASFPAGTLVGNTLTWDKTNIPELAALGTGIRQITVLIRAGIPGNGINGATSGYYMPAASNNITNYASIESDVTSPPIYGDTTSTIVNQYCGVQINDASGVIKSATNTVLYYLMQVNNDGNIYDQFDFSVLNHACVGKDFDPLNHRLLDLSGNVITETPWIPPHSTYQFLVELTAPIGSNPFHFSCHDVTVTSTACPGTTDVGLIETEIVGSPKYPLINISKIESKDPVERGEEFTYTIFVFNSNDKYPANNFKLLETYDANIEFVSAVPAPDAGTNNQWSLGSLGYGLDSAKTVVITVRVKESAVCSGSISNTVSCSYTNQNRYPTATAITTILGHPDLAITKSVITDTDPAVIGGNATYTLRYKNAGNCVAENVVLKDFFDNKHLNPVSVPGGIVSGGMIQWNLGSLNPGDSGVFVYSMYIDPTASFNPGLTLVRNFANISTSSLESEYNNNAASAMFSITLLPDLQISKSEPDSLLAGASYTYTITVVNNGEYAASDVVISDELPATLQFVSASGGGIYSGGTVTWPSVSSLAVDATVSRTVTVIPLCTGIPSVTNIALVSTATLESGLSNNTDTAVSVVADKTIPEITCQSAKSVNTNKGCVYLVGGTEWDAIATDNCGVDSIRYVISGATNRSGTSLNGVAFNIGISTVTWTVTDESGNVNFCSFTVEVKDAQNPVFTSCPNGEEFILPTDSGYSTYTKHGTGWNATATDNCSVDSLFYLLSGATSGSGLSLDGVAFNMGTTTVLWTAVDASGNKAYCSFTVIVNDHEGPVFSFCLAGNNPAVNTDPGVNTYTQPDNSWDAIASDNDGISSLSYVLAGATSGSGTSLAGVVFNLGTTTVTFTAVDSSGNEVTCIFDVIVSDNQDPIFSFCLSGDDQEVNTDLGVNSYTQPDNSWDAIASDNDGIASLTYVLTGATSDSGTSLAGVVFNLGTTTVTFTAVDSSGNEVTCIFDVIVSDNQDPIFSFCLAGDDQEVNTDLGVNTYTQPDASWDAVATDNDGIASLTYVLTGATSGSGESLAGVIFNLGTTEVTFTAVDSSGNEVTCIFDVIVSDNQDPIFSFCLAGDDQEVNTDLGVNTYTQPDNSWDAIASDNDGIASLTYVLTGVTSGTGTSLAGVVFNLGTTTVTFTAVDSSGNEVTCVFDVIVSDNQDPIFSFCLAGDDQEVNTDLGVNTYTQPDNSWDAIASDNDGIASLTYVLTGATSGTGTSLAGVVFNLGTTTVTFTAVDSSGNEVTCIFDVIVSDNQDPIFSFCLAGDDQEVNTDLGVNTYTQPDNSWDAIASDNDGIASLTYVLTGATSGTGASLAGVVFNLGTTKVTFTAVDSSGNEVTCVFDVIVSDNQDPIFSFCLASDDQEVNTDLGVNTYTQPDNSWDAIASDNDGIASLTYVLTGVTSGTGTSLAGVVFNLGTTTVTFTAVDSSGNEVTCIFDVIVSDNQDPIFSFCLAGDDQEVNTDLGVNTYTQPDASWDAIASDNDGIASLTYVLTGVTSGTGTSLAGVVFNLGTTTVTFTAVDSSGNEVTCIFDVIVSDNQDPIFSFCHAGDDQKVNTDLGVNTYTQPDASWDAIASDNDGIASLTYVLTGATSGTGTSLAGVVFNLGTTTVTFTAVDSSGNEVTCVFDVIVSDNENPTFSFCLAGNDQTVSTDPGTNTYTQTDASWDAIAVDNDGIASLTYIFEGATSGTGTTLEGVAFNIGTTRVIFVAIDSSGNYIKCAFDVTVIDNENPVFTFCLAGDDQKVTTDPGVSTYTNLNENWDAIAVDNDGIASLTYVLSGATTGSGTTLAGVVFNLGSTVVTWTAIDNGGNSTQCVFRVIVIDNEPPVIVCPPARDFCSVDEINIGIATATDNVQIAGIVNDAPSVFPVGTTVVTWTAYDEQGNTSICKQIIVVTQISDVYAGKDAEFCQGTPSYTLSDAAANNYKSLLWSVDEGYGHFEDPTVLNATFIPSSSVVGNVNLKLTALSYGTCPSTSDMVMLKLDKKPELAVNNYEPICSGESISLSADGAAYYEWLPGDMIGSTVEVTPLQSMVYTIFGYSKEGCLDTALIKIEVKQSPDVQLTANPSSVYMGDEVELIASGADFSYTWNIDGLYGDHGFLTITQDTTVVVVGEAFNGCRDTDTTVIRILGYWALKIPEGYSPNFDGNHDYFEIKGIDQFPGNVLKVYNRWGSLVFESEGYHNEWNGYSNSNLLKGDTKLPEGTYYYILDLRNGSALYSGPVYISR